MYDEAYQKSQKTDAKLENDQAQIMLAIKSI